MEGYQVSWFICTATSQSYDWYGSCNGCPDCCGDEEEDIVVEEEASLTLDDDDLDDNENLNQQETIFNSDFEEIPNPHANITMTVVISIS